MAVKLKIGAKIIGVAATVFLTVVGAIVIFTNSISYKVLNAAAYREAELWAAPSASEVEGQLAEAFTAPRPWPGPSWA